MHEGGFTIHRDSNGGIYFRRPDGRAIPRSGYRVDDMVDHVAVAPPGKSASAEVRMAAVVHAYTLDDERCADSVRNPSAEGFGRTGAIGRAVAEVREPRGVYRFRTIAP